jgi:hypothetical protein
MQFCGPYVTKEIAIEFCCDSNSVSAGWFVPNFLQTTILKNHHDFYKLSASV